MNNKTNRNYGPPYLEIAAKHGHVDSPCLDAVVDFASHERHNNTTSAIVDSLFRLVRDGSALRGPFGARHRGAAGATGKLES